MLKRQGTELDRRPNWPVVEPAVRGEIVRRFFEERAKRYDEIARRPYWRFCGDLLHRLLELNLESRLDRDRRIRILDAGGGTGLWGVRLAAEFPRAESVLLDFSEAMLAAAVTRARRAGVVRRFSIREGNLHDPIDRTLGLFDLVVCFHNVASLVADPAALLRNLRDALAPDGTLALVVPNRYQASFTCVRDGRFSELRRIREKSAVRYHPGFPDVYLFTPDLIRRMLAEAGFRDITVHGYPVSIAPVLPDASLPPHLTPTRVRRRLLASELSLCMEEEAAARGQNLLAIGRLSRRRRRASAEPIQELQRRR